ncbi:MAG TPA: LemA family protein [Chitinophagaceae bacterium]
MKGRNITLIIILAAVLLIGGCGCSGYNNLVGQDEAVKKAWNNVQSDYQNRADLVPNLVNTVKGAANFEQETLTRVIEARSKATAVNVNAENLTPEKMQQFQQAQAELSGALSRLLVTVERYPDLKANQNFLQLQGQLEGIENGIRNSRNNFNAAVNEYNVQVRRFPTNIFAGMFGFRAREGFQADPGSQNAPKVQF